MENITIEKVISFDNTLDSIIDVLVDDNIKYNIFDDSTHVEGIINVKGKVKTLLEEKDFNDEVNIDIFTPLNKVIDKDLFQIKVVDYSYVLQNKNLLIYIVLNVDGIVNQKEEVVKNEVLDINKLNVIEEQREQGFNEEVVEETPLLETLKEDNLVIKDNCLSDGVNKTWATDLFKLTDNYTLFMKISLK